MTTALMLRERWTVDDPAIDFLVFMHDKRMYEEMNMYVTAVGDVKPSAVCRCGCTAEVHKTIDEDTSTGLIQYYDECTVQGCECRCFEEKHV